MIGILNNLSRKMFGGRRILSRVEQNKLMFQISVADEFDGCKEEFEKLYDILLYPLWTSLSNKYIPPLSIEDLEDVFQEAWIKLLESRKKYDNKSDVYNWIYVINKNLILDKIRKIKRTEETSIDEIFEVDEDVWELQLPNDESLVIDDIISKESVQIVRLAIESIPDDIEREIIKRRIIHEQKLEMISKDLNIPLTTVFKKVKKGLESIKPKIKKTLIEI